LRVLQCKDMVEETDQLTLGRLSVTLDWAQGFIRLASRQRRHRR
jgi:hypothetical protein